MRTVIQVWFVSLMLAACATDLPSSDTAAAARFPVPTGQWRQIIPSPDLPAEVTTYASNNNLDIAMFEGSLYIAFRTAPSHFAGPDTLIHVLRTDNPEAMGPWVLERTYFTGKDLREPRFFVLGDKLYLYISELGTELTSFNPGRVFGVTRDRAGVWSEPRDVFTDGRVVWRTKTRNGQVYMTSYTGGENEYQENEGEGTVKIYFTTTDDGWNWRGVDPERPMVLMSGGSETDFEFDAQGNLYAVIRNEGGDESGFGSILCRADADDLGNWQCLPESDPHKYDSPYTFKYGDLIYLIARYNSLGPFDYYRDEPHFYTRFLRNEIRYSTSAKHTALYGYDTQNMQIVPLDVFPSAGDTAFASGVWLDDHRHLVMNYSSDPSHPDMTWIEGQFRGSQIYGAILDFGE